MSQLGFCRIKVNTPSPPIYAHALEKRVPFPLCWGSQLLFPLSPKFPRFQSALAGFSASPDFSISPKETKKQNAFSSKQLNCYAPVSWAVIIHLIGLLLKKEKKKMLWKFILHLKHYFPVSCKCFANAHPPFPSPHKSSRSHSSQRARPYFPVMLPWKCVPTTSVRIPSSSSRRCPSPDKARLGLDTRQTRN